MNLLELTGRDKNHLVQLCLPIEKSKGRLSFPVMGSIKYDGVYGLIVVSGDDVHIFSRTGEEFTSLEHLKEEARYLKTDRPYVYIAELYNKYYPQPTVSGWCRDTKEQHPGVVACIHDCMPLEDFIKGYCPIPFAERQQKLKSIKTEIKYPYYNTVFVIQHTLEDMNDLMAYTQFIWDNGGEGVVAVPCDAPYQAGKRNVSMVKLKKGVSYDLLVVNIQEGKGKFERMVGNLVCQDRNGKIINVGSGLTETERKAWYKKPEGIIGKIVTISAMEVSTKGVLREPRFKEIRHDKCEEDAIC